MNFPKYAEVSRTCYFRISHSVGKFSPFPIEKEWISRRIEKVGAKIYLLPTHLFKKNISKRLSYFFSSKI